MDFIPLRAVHDKSDLSHPTHADTHHTRVTLAGGIFDKVLYNTVYFW